MFQLEGRTQVAQVVDRVQRPTGSPNEPGEAGDMDVNRADVADALPEFALALTLGCSARASGVAELADQAPTLSLTLGFVSFRPLVKAVTRKLGRGT